VPFVVQKISSYRKKAELAKYRPAFSEEVICSANPIDLLIFKG